MIGNARGWLGVFALGIALLSGCTALLGDFSSTDTDAIDASLTAPGDSAVVRDAAAALDAPGSGDEGVMDGGAAEGGSNGCGPGQLSCSAGCVSAQDVHTCGACNRDCTLLLHVAAAGLGCAGNACTFLCAPGYDHCSTHPDDVCETDLSASDHCGSCNTACSGDTPVCALSNATYACASNCPAGTTECSGTCANLMADDGHCGGCTTACTGGMGCDAGTCACPATLTNCGGTCYATADDPTHCGPNCLACPPPANGGATCSGGGCGTACNTGYSACGGSTPCAYDTNNDATHCGSSCTNCGSGMTCSGGSCVCSTPGYTACQGVCTNTNSDPNNCGSCGHVCSGGCSGGTCTCASVICGAHNCGCAGTCCGSGGTTCCAPP
jgi:hypothetical protein